MTKKTASLLQSGTNSFHTLHCDESDWLGNLIIWRAIARAPWLCHERERKKEEGKDLRFFPYGWHHWCVGAFFVGKQSVSVWLYTIRRLALHFALCWLEEHRIGCQRDPVDPAPVSLELHCAGEREWTSGLYPLSQAQLAGSEKLCSNTVSIKASKWTLGGRKKRIINRTRR